MPAYDVQALLRGSVFQVQAEDVVIIKPQTDVKLIYILHIVLK